MISEQKARIIWHAMHQRCNKSSKVYQGASVSLEWKEFQPFYEWAKEHYIEGYQLDKDLVCYANREYGPQTCTFVPSFINKLLTSSSATRGAYPIGVSLRSDGKAYEAVCRAHGKRRHLGSYSTPMLAHRTYQLAKMQAINESVMIYTNAYRYDVRVCNTLLDYSDKLYMDYICNRETVV